MTPVLKEKGIDLKKMQAAYAILNCTVATVNKNQWQ